MTIGRGITWTLAGALSLTGLSLTGLSLTGLSLTGLLATAQRVSAADELERRATWQIPAAAEVRAQLQGWLDTQQLDEAAKLQAEVLWPPEAIGDDVEVLDRLAAVLAAVDPQARELVEFCSKMRTAPVVPTFAILADAQAAPFIRDNLRLYLARWLSQNDLYDEALRELAQVDPTQVADPAAVFFYQSIAHHRLLQKQECLPVLRRLLENEARLPRRFVTLAKLMEKDLEPLEPDSPDEIARLMDSVTRRLGLGRAGARVRKEEDDIVDKLDKIIKKMEEQQQQQMASSGSAGNNLRPSSPMQDSMPGGGTGPGNVDQKGIGNTAGWGNLPLKERQETLQEITKDLPAHYRGVIEEYFRRLAQESGER